MTSVLIVRKQRFSTIFKKKIVWSSTSPCTSWISLLNSSFLAQTTTTRKWRTEAVGDRTSKRLGKDHVQVSTRYATADPHGQRRNENSEYLQRRISTGKNHVIADHFLPCSRLMISENNHSFNEHLYRACNVDVGDKTGNWWGKNLWRMVFSLTDLKWRWAEHLFFAKRQ